MLYLEESTNAPALHPARLPHASCLLDATGAESPGPPPDADEASRFARLGWALLVARVMLEGIVLLGAPVVGHLQNWDSI